MTPLILLLLALLGLWAVWGDVHMSRHQRKDRP